MTVTLLYMYSTPSCIDTPSNTITVLVIVFQCTKQLSLRICIVANVNFRERSCTSFATDGSGFFRSLKVIRSVVETISHFNKQTNKLKVRTITKHNRGQSRSNLNQMILFSSESVVAKKRPWSSQSVGNVLQRRSSLLPKPIRVFCSLVRNISII